MSRKERVVASIDRVKVNVLYHHICTLSFTLKFAINAVIQGQYTYTHTCIHTRTHARTHTHTHTFEILMGWILELVWI